MRFCFALGVLTALSLWTRAIEAADYEYPYRDPYLATATSAMLGNDEATARIESNIFGRHSERGSFFLRILPTEGLRIPPSRYISVHA